MLYVPAWYYKRSGAVGADDFSSLRHKILRAKFNISVSAPKISDWSRGVTHFYRRLMQLLNQAKILFKPTVLFAMKSNIEKITVVRSRSLSELGYSTTCLD